MKDTTISYDIVHHQQQQQQQQHHHHHHHQQQQQHSWGQQQQHQRQHQTHSANVYGNQSTQRTNIGGQQHASASQLDQYQQQLQSTATQNSNYYQQAAHLYPTYQHGHSQDQQQQHSSNTENQHHQHHPVSAANPSSVVNPGHNQQHVHHQQGLNNTQTTTLNHTGWSTPGMSSMTPQGHHPVVTDHSTLAYMTHEYQSHTSMNDHHRNTQPIGTGPQGSNYTVDSLYNTGNAAAVVAAAAAYGYNNYNAPFFQTSNNNPQTGHPQTSISTFWNHNHAQPQQQQRVNHSQAVPNQDPLQQHRQAIGSDQNTSSNNYIHDPLMYYNRGAYGQNFGQTQAPGQADVLHQRMTAALSQQLLQHHEQLHQVAPHQQLHPQQQSLSTLAGTNPTQANDLSDNQSILQTTVQQTLNGQAGGQISSTSPIGQINRQLQQLNLDNQQQKTTSLDLENISKPISYDINTNKAPHQKSQQNQPIQRNNAASSTKDLTTGKQNSSSLTKESQQATVSITSASGNSNKHGTINNQNVIKNESNQFQRKAQDSLQASGISNYYRDTQSDRMKPQPSETARKPESEIGELKSKPKTESITKHQDSPEKVSPIDDNLTDLSDSSSRKTTWASIASQPAKVSQPKSLKSKIAGSNSVLSSAKHLAAVSLDTTNMESKNGINPAIKSSVSAAATSIQNRSSVPPPISKLPAVAASLKLDLLGKDSDTTKISWPAVNASINLKLDDPPLQKSSPPDEEQSTSNVSDKQRRDFQGYRGRDNRNSMYNDHVPNSNTRLMNSNQGHGGREGHWTQRRDTREDRVRRDSDRRELSDSRENSVDYNRRGGDSNRPNGMGMGRNHHFRGDERDQYRDRDKERDFGPRGRNQPPSVGMPNERVDSRCNDNYQNQRFQNNRFEPRNNYQNNMNMRQQPNDNNQSTQHHHYNNVRDGNTASSSLSKQDLSLYPQLDPANFNPKSFDLDPKDARYFVIKSYSEDDIHKSIKYSIWCSTNHGNKRLDEAYKQQQQRTKDGPIYLFFSVNGSGHFCGMAQMMSSVDFDSSSGVWAQSKWQGEFSVKWIFVKDVPNSALRHITLENNEDKPVTNSRDTQEVPSDKGKAVLKILHQYQHSGSLFDDFLHYERRQEEEKLKKTSALEQPVSNNRPFEERGNVRGFNGRPFMFSRPHNEFQHMRDRSRFTS